MSKKAIESIQSRFGDAVVETHSRAGDDTAVVNRHRWLEAVSYVRDELGFDLYVDFTAVDYLNIHAAAERFEVVLHLRNMKTGERIRLKARLPEDSPVVDSLVGLYKGANWFERECHEMYGIKFKGHPDLRPLLLYPEFKGHPLRKDYPIDGRQPRVKLLASEDRRFSRPMDETPHGHDPRFKGEKE